MNSMRDALDAFIRDGRRCADGSSTRSSDRTNWINDALVRIEGLCMMIDSLHSMVPTKVTPENIDELAKRLCEETFDARLELLKAHNPKNYKTVKHWDDLTDYSKSVWRLIVISTQDILKSEGGGK